MFNIVSLLIGIVAAPLVALAFLPLLGWALWLILPLPAVGLVFGIVSRHRTGLRLNGVLLAIGMLRLLIGHGIF